MTDKKTYILNKERTGKKLKRMAIEILEKNIHEQEIILAGIQDSGSVVAFNIQKLLNEISAVKTELITISMDKKSPGEIKLSKISDFHNKVIIIIDDVASSGKTMMFALKPFLDFRPKKIQTLVLVERSHKVFPVQPDYVGLSVATTLLEQIIVEVEGNEVTGAYLT